MRLARAEALTATAAGTAGAPLAPLREGAVPRRALQLRAWPRFLQHPAAGQAARPCGPYGAAQTVGLQAAAALPGAPVAQEAIRVRRRLAADVAAAGHRGLERYGAGLATVQRMVRDLSNKRCNCPAQPNCT